MYTLPHVQASSCDPRLRDPARHRPAGPRRHNPARRRRRARRAQVDGAKRPQYPGRSRPAGGVALPIRRTAPGRPRHGGGRSPPAAVHLLHGCNRWRRLEDHRQRANLGQRLGRLFRDRFDWRHRRCRVRPERRVCRDGQRRHPKQRDRRQGRVQVHRRGEELDVCRASGRGADRRGQGGPAEPRCRLRRGTRPAVRPEPRAGRIQDDRRRQDVEEVAVHQRQDGRRVAGDEPCHARRNLRGRVARRAAAVDDRQRRAGERGRRLQDDRRRQHLDAPRERPAARRGRQGRRGRLRVQAVARLRHPRGARHAGGYLSIRRWRRDGSSR